MTKEELPACPVATAVQIIGSEWKLLITRNLLTRPWRFNELKRDWERISQKALADSLCSMEADGIITRTAYPEVSLRVEYALSNPGESMRLIMKAMGNRSTEYKKGKLPQQPFPLPKSKKEQRACGALLFFCAVNLTSRSQK